MSQEKFKRPSFRNAFKLYKEFREAAPTSAKRVHVRIPKTVMHMGDVEYIGYRTTHGRKVVHYHHDFAPGSRPILGAGPGRNELVLIGGRYHVTDRGIVDLDTHGREIDEPTHGQPIDSDD